MHSVDIEIFSVQIPQALLISLGNNKWLAEKFWELKSTGHKVAKVGQL